MSTRVSLVLGSGGARGMAHIGIIKWLEEHDYKIESISGCSMGALVGGMYAIGKLDEFSIWLRSLDTFSMLKLLDFKGSGGLVSGNKLMKKLEELFTNPNIEDLHVSYTAVASDIEEEKEIWINQGPILDAIRASISLPLFFTPYKYNDKELVDGGVLNPVPIAPTFHDDTDITIAVNLGGKTEHNIQLKKIQQESNLSSKITAYLNQLKLPEVISLENGVYKVANNSFDSMQGTIARMKLATYPPDFEITIPRNLCGTLEFNIADEVIQYGYDLCEEIMKK
jgi:NTE family protein